MVAIPKLPYITPREYLELEQHLETKNEYYDGVIVAMAGASPSHIRIEINVSSELHQQLKNKQCETFGGNMRVHVPVCNRYFYPDLSVVCGSPSFDELAGVKTLQDPVLIVEVLSPSTELYDRGDKFTCWQTVDSLMTYLLISQDRPRVEWYTRQANGKWLYEKLEGLDAVLDLPEIGCRLNFADIYSRVEFAPESTQNIA